MAPILAIIEIIFAILLIFWVANRLHNQLNKEALGIVLLLGVAVGIGLAWWLAFNFDYQPSDRLVVHSFPVPVGFEALEEHPDGQMSWTDFVVPAPMFVVVANAGLIFSISISLVYLIYSGYCRLNGRSTGVTKSLED